MKHDEPETMYSLEWLEHERRKAWQEATRPVGKTRNAIFRSIQAKTHTRRPSKSKRKVNDGRIGQADYLTGDIRRRGVRHAWLKHL